MYIPVIIVFFLAVLLFTRAPRTVAIPALLAGLVLGVFNVLGDLLAYFAHWWHYNLSGLIFHLPIPFYITPILTYGASAYLIIWRLQRTRYHWIAQLLLFGLPVFGIVRDVYSGFTAAATITWDNPIPATIFTIILWPLMFYTGYAIFTHLAPDRVDVVEEVDAEQQSQEGAQPGKAS